MAQDEPLALDHTEADSTLLVGQVLLGVLGPEAEGVGSVEDLGELGVLAGLAGLGDDRLDHAVGVVGEPLLGAQKHAPAPLEAQRLPGRLGGTRLARELGDVGRRQVGHLGDHLAGGRVGDLDRSDRPPPAALPLPCWVTCSSTLAIGQGYLREDVVHGDPHAARPGPPRGAAARARRGARRTWRSSPRDGVPIVEWETGRLLATLVAALAPGRVVEVGTAIGYSTLHMARELPSGGRIVTLERDPGRIAQARGFWERAGLADRIELVEGDALESLERLDGPFDLVFLDASKTEVEPYLELLRGKLADRCLLVVDNLLMGGFAALRAPRPKAVVCGRTRTGRPSRCTPPAATRRLMTSEEWLFSLLPVGDGVGLGARRRRGS